MSVLTSVISMPVVRSSVSRSCRHHPLDGTTAYVVAASCAGTTASSAVHSFPNSLAAHSSPPITSASSAEPYSPASHAIHTTNCSAFALLAWADLGVLCLAWRQLARESAFRVLHIRDDNRRQSTVDCLPPLPASHIAGSCGAYGYDNSRRSLPSPPRTPRPPLLPQLLAFPSSSTISAIGGAPGQSSASVGMERE
ncbi:hypothetical protein DFH06DRAFT_1333037 [Mycena polygramma]|nr:hypothetical protein DFH06DRAFT_1333037 [Mycena polygramma]